MVWTLPWCKRQQVCSGRVMSWSRGLRCGCQRCLKWPLVAETESQSDVLCLRPSLTQPANQGNISLIWTIEVWVSILGKFFSTGSKSVVLLRYISDLWEDYHFLLRRHSVYCLVDELQRGSFCPHLRKKNDLFHPGIVRKNFWVRGFA